MELVIRKGVHGATNFEVVPVIEDKIEASECPSGKGSLKKLIKKNKFSAKFGEVFTLVKEIDDEFKYTMYIGLGKEEDMTIEKIRIASSKAVKKAISVKEDIIHISYKELENIKFKDNFRAIIEGAVLSSYKFEKYKTSNENNYEIKEISITGLDENNYEMAHEALKEAKALIYGTIIARDLVNEPANVMYPDSLAKIVKQLGNEKCFEVEVFNKSKIEELNMKSFLEVSRGAEKEPKLIVMRYFGDESNKKNILGLVGKGLTYDSGGYSIKSTSSMKDMKSDMGGAAAVVGTMASIAEMNLKVNVIAVIAACENMISGGAYKPGDIIGSMAGKTIEVLNTDAEGRLTLIDAVHYIIEKEKVDKIVDVATLTGAALSALGTTTTAVITNNDEFYNQLNEASLISGEKFWQLPSFDEYKELIKSNIADLKNIGGKYAGTITAGLFIGEFVQNKPWLHLDIAGTSWCESSKDYNIKGGTGAPVRTLYYLIKNLK